MKTLVISIGGSMINPGTVNVSFLKHLKPVLLKAAKKNKIVVVTGGGKLAREYIDALKDKSNDVQSMVGIHATRLNAHLLAAYLECTNQEMPENLEEVRDMLASFPIVVCGGLGPGTTSDGTTASIADYVGAKTMINLTNVKGLYTKDPHKYKDATFISRISHTDFKKILDTIKEKPGQHFVLDSLAARTCREGKIDVIILEGVKNLEKVLLGKKFVGTVIS